MMTHKGHLRQDNTFFCHLCRSHMKYNVLMTHRQRKCSLNWFSRSDEAFLSLETKTDQQIWKGKTEQHLASAGATAERAAKPPTMGGKPGSARRGYAHSRRRHSLCLWYQMNITGLCLNTHISCKKGTSGQATCKSTTDRPLLWPARYIQCGVCSAITSMHKQIL